MSQYIPQKDALAQQWLDNFSIRLNANPALYGLDASDATAIKAAVDNFDAAMLLVISPATKTKVTVAAKDAAKSAAIQLCRVYAQLVRKNAGVSNGDKTDLGLTLADPTPTPVPVPNTSPMLQVEGATPLQLTLRFHDQNTPTSRAKPAGVKFLEMYAAASAIAITDPATLPFKRLASKQPIALDFTQADVGKTAYIAARYVNPRGEPGPWSTIVTFTVANG